MNCPNCTAPLQVNAGSQSATCSYCRSTFVPRHDSPAISRSAVAAERSAAELALRRLKRELRETENELHTAQYLAGEPQREAERKHEREIEAYEFDEMTRGFKRDEDRRGRNSGLGCAVLVLPILAITKWGWLWYVIGFFIFCALIIHLGVLANAKKKRPIRPFFRTKPPSGDEVRLAQKLEEIDAEITRHRQFLEESKPAYASDDTPQPLTPMPKPQDTNSQALGKSKPADAVNDLPQQRTPPAHR